MVESALIWVAECDAMTLRLRLPARQDGHACVTRAKFHVPEGVRWSEVDVGQFLPFTHDAVTVQGLLKIKPAYVWEYLTPVSHAVAAQLRYECGNYLPWHPVDAHVAEVEAVFELDVPITFSQCWGKHGLATRFSSRQRLFIPVAGGTPEVRAAYCGAMTVEDVCRQFTQSPASIKALLLPHPLGSLLLHGKITQLVLLARYYQKVGNQIDSIIPAWPPHDWLVKARATIHTSYKACLQAPGLIPPHDIADLAMNLRLWSGPILAAAGTS